ncbi:MAG: hypothetical protein KIT33_13975 [Candidatus Kapabacteria bacterium]|nr:hypothetical protein [Ignavibacteriota bacterium]MCW5886074.1 hypothetical protein [Candidatus Kapabacteria bacterium]
MENKEVYLNEGENNMIETPQELINSTIERVENILKDKFEDYLAFGNGTFTISRGASQVMIIVRPFTESETVIECMANVVSGAVISNDLMQFLLRKNAELHFGAFGLLFDNSIIFQHSIAGTNVDANELAISVNAVAIIADHYVDEIISMAGGSRSAESSEE